MRRHLNDEPVEACPPRRVPVSQVRPSQQRIALATNVPGGSDALGRALALPLGSRLPRCVREKTRSRQQERAERQQGRADKNFQRAIDAVDQMLTQVADKELADVPQLEPIREKLLEKALAFYQGLQNENDSDPKVRHETGLAHRRSGDLLTLMGQQGDDEKEFQQAKAMLAAPVAEFPEDPTYANELARSVFKFSGRAQESEQELTSAIKRKRPSLPNIRKNRNTKKR